MVFHAVTFGGAEGSPNPMKCQLLPNHAQSLTSLDHRTTLTCFCDEFRRFQRRHVGAEAELGSDGARPLFKDLLALLTEAEEERQSAEDNRQIAEEVRASAEHQRCTDEIGRAQAEAIRQMAEAARVMAEEARQTMEQARQLNEQTRALAHKMPLQCDMGKAHGVDKPKR